MDSKNVTMKGVTIKKQQQKNTKIKGCCVFNIAPLYREAIYRQLSKSEDVEYTFFVGQESLQIEALADMTRIKGFKRYLHNVYVKEKLVWQKGWLRTVLGNYDAYVLTGNEGIRSNWLIVLWARMTGRKVLLWTHGLYGNETSFKRTKNLLYMRMVSGLLLYGKRGWYLLKKNGYPKERMTVVYNSLNYDLHMRLRDKYVNAGFMRNYFGNDYPVLVFVGRLTRIKSLDLLIKSVALLKYQGVDVNILFLGAGGERKSLETLVEDVGIDDRVWFYGACYDEEMVASMLQNSTLCISPGNVGLTAVHAFSYGIPVITHNRYSQQMPEFEVIEPGVNGDFFNYGDVFSLSETIEKWVTLLKDPHKAKKVKEACYKVVDCFYNPRKQADIINAAIVRICSKR